MNSTQKIHKHLSLTLLLALFSPVAISTTVLPSTEIRNVTSQETEALSILEDLATPDRYGTHISWENFVDTYTAAIDNNADLAQTARFLKDLRNVESEMITWSLYSCLERLPQSISTILQKTESRILELRIKEGRAIEFLKKTLLAKRSERKKISWTRFVDTLTGYLDGNDRYIRLCAALKSKRNSRNYYAIGMAIEKELASLPSIIQKKGEELGVKHFEEVLTEMLSFKG